MAWFVINYITLRTIGPDTEFLNFLIDSVAVSVRYDDRVTALTWASQVITALRAYVDELDTPPALLVKTIGHIASLVVQYLQDFDIFESEV